MRGARYASLVGVSLSARTLAALSFPCVSNLCRISLALPLPLPLLLGLDLILSIRSRALIDPCEGRVDGGTGVFKGGGAPRGIRSVACVACVGCWRDVTLVPTASGLAAAACLFGIAWVPTASGLTFCRSFSVLPIFAFCCTRAALPGISEVAVSVDTGGFGAAGTFPGLNFLKRFDTADFAAETPLPTGTTASFVCKNSVNGPTELRWSRKSLRLACLLIVILFAPKGFSAAVPFVAWSLGRGTASRGLGSPWTLGSPSPGGVPSTIGTRRRCRSYPCQCADADDAVRS